MKNLNWPRLSVLVKKHGGGAVSFEADLGPFGPGGAGGGGPSSRELALKQAATSTLAFTLSDNAVEGVMMMVPEISLGMEIACSFVPGKEAENGLAFKSALREMILG